MDTHAMVSPRQTNKAGMTHVPVAIKPDQVAVFDRKAIPLRQSSAVTERFIGSQRGSLVGRRTRFHFSHPFIGYLTRSLLQNRASGIKSRTARADYLYVH